MTHRIFTTPVASVYRLYVAKVERKRRTAGEVDAVIHWLTGHTPAGSHRYPAHDGLRTASFRASGAHVLLSTLRSGSRKATALGSP